MKRILFTLVAFRPTRHAIGHQLLAGLLRALRQAAQLTLALISPTNRR
jgi:hypothetical protein